MSHINTEGNNVKFKLKIDVYDVAKSLLSLEYAVESEGSLQCDHIRCQLEYVGPL